MRDETAHEWGTRRRTGSLALWVGGNFGRRRERAARLCDAPLMQVRMNGASGKKGRTEWEHLTLD